MVKKARYLLRVLQQVFCPAKKEHYPQQDKEIVLVGLRHMLSQCRWPLYWPLFKEAPYPC
jgi:hypothetical protein